MPRYANFSRIVTKPDAAYFSAVTNAEKEAAESLKTVRLKNRFGALCLVPPGSATKAYTRGRKFHISHTVI